MRMINIPNLEEVEREASGFAPTIARLMAAIATQDGYVTTQEYACLIEAANRLTTFSDDPAFITALTMRSLDGPHDVEQVLTQLKDAAKGQEMEARKVALEIIVPLVRLQGDDALDLLERVAKALDVPVSGSALGVHGPIRSRTFLNRTTDSISRLVGRKTDENRYYLVTTLQAYGQVDLAKQIAARQEEGAAADEIQVMCRDFIEQITQDVNNLLQQRTAMAQRREVVELLNDATRASVRQVDQRLAALVKRIEWQKQTFREDVKAFVEDAANDVELVMRDRMRSDDWLDKNVWESFAKSQHGRAVQVRYGQLQRRYEQQFDLLNEELMLFREELMVTRSKFLDSVDHKQFGRLVPPPSFSARVLGSIDNFANGTLWATGLTAAGGVAAVASGTVAAAAFAPIAAPLAAVVFGPMAVAGLWKWVSDPEKRKDKEMRVKRKDIEGGLERMMAEHVATHDKMLDTIVDEFYIAASSCLTPLAHSSQRMLDIIIMQDRWIEKSALHAHESITRITGAPAVQSS